MSDSLVSLFTIREHMLTDFQSALYLKMTQKPAGARKVYLSR